MQIVHAHPQRCLRKLAPGTVKRFPSRGGVAQGYVLACAGCGFRAMYMPGEATFTESAKWTTREAPDANGKLVHVAQPETLSLAGTIRCLACKKDIRIVENDMTAA